MDEHHQEKLERGFSSPTSRGADIFSDLLCQLRKIVGPRTLRNPIDVLKDLDTDAFKVTLSKVPFDILGKIFEQLLPEADRYFSGQHYTRSDIVDLILGFCVKTPDVTVLDPSCGTGSFLLRTYYRLRYLGNQKPHLELLKQIRGIERAEIPSHLTKINLAARNISSEDYSSQIVTKDFFDVSPTSSHFFGQIDIVLGNPPFTRQELLSTHYKAKLRKVTLQDYNIALGSQAGLYAHFLVHSARFLAHKNGNRLGYVMLRSFLDVSFGNELKNFLLKHFRIIAIIQSLQEKWFPDAQIIPCLIILETETRRTERDEHQVRFVQIESKIEELFPPIDLAGNPSVPRDLWKRIDEFVQYVENSNQKSAQNENYITFGRVTIEDTEMYRILSIKQKNLMSEEKWGMFLTAPRSYFQVLEKNQTNGIFIKLGDITSITTGLKSGANEFFYFPNRNFEIKEVNDQYMIIQGKKGLKPYKFEIESEFLSPILRKFKSQTKIMIDKNDGYCLTVSKSNDELRKNNKQVLKYIEFGEKYPESKPYSTRPTCQSRKTRGGREWYNIDYKVAAPLLHFEIETNREITFRYDKQQTDSILNKSFMSNYGFYNITPKNPDDAEVILGILNSTYGMMMIEFGGRYIENRDGTISNQTRVYELKNLPIIDPAKIPGKLKQKITEIMRKMRTRKIHPIWDEMDQQDRKELDQIIFELILGLSSTELEELRTSISRFVKTRNVRKKS